MEFAIWNSLDLVSLSVNTIVIVNTFLILLSTHVLIINSLLSSSFHHHLFHITNILIPAIYFVPSNSTIINCPLLVQVAWLAVEIWISANSVEHRIYH